MIHIFYLCISALYLLACIALAPATSFAESSVKPIRQYVHNVWRTEEGLPQNSVQAILQTRDGYLWLGTQEGLVRFNGAEFTVFNKANTDLIKHNDVRALLEDREGNLWIGTFGGGVVLYRNGQFLRVYNRNEGLADNFVNALLQDKQGNIWIATNKGLNKFSTGRFTVISSDHGPSESINSLAEDQHGNIWLGTNRGLGQVFQGKATASIANLAGKVIRTVFIDRSGTLWIGTDQTGLFALREGKIIQFGPGEQLPKAPILAMMQDMQGALWVGTGAGGVCRLTKLAPQSLFECYSSKDGLMGDSVMSLFEDNEKSIWVGTETGGLNRFKTGAMVTYGAASGFDGAVRSIYEAHDHSVWVALDTGLRRVKDGHVARYLTKKGPANNYAWAVAEDRQGKIWVGTNEGGLNVFTAKGLLKTYTSRDGLADDQVHAVFQSEDGSIWIGTERGGVSLFANGKFRTYSTKDGLANNRVWTIFEDHNQTLWFGTDSGLSRFEHGKFTSVNLEDDQSVGTATGGVMYIYEDREHVLWIGTYGSGLKRVDHGKVTSYTTRNGLFDDNVWAVLEDDLGNFWMSSNLGIFRVSKQELVAFAQGRISRINSISYGMSDGMLGTECNGGSQNAAWKTREGTLLFACVRGIVAITPGSVAPNPLPPPVVVERAVINGRQVSQGNAPIPTGRGELEFHFAGLSYLAPEKVAFKYKLEGFDKDWLSVGARRAAYYTNIPPGPYRFRVIASNNDGVWNETGATFEFYLKPRFYQTVSFYISIAFSLVGIGIGIYLLRVRALRKREEELLAIVNRRTSDLQQEVAQHKLTAAHLEEAKQMAESANRVKSEFLANMSHEIRTPLNGVLGMTELALGTTVTPEQQDFLSTAYQSGQMLLNVVNDILDFSKIEAGKLQTEQVPVDIYELVELTTKCVAVRAHQKKLELLCDVEPNVPQFIRTDPTRLKQVLLNLLGNALKFTTQGEIALNVRRKLGEQDTLEFSVSDTGIGIPEDKLKTVFEAFSQADASTTRQYGGTGLGLAISRRLVELMGGTMELKSEVRRGTIVSLSMPLLATEANDISIGVRSSVELAGLRVLVVDDNATNRQILERMLCNWGIRVDTIADGPSALRALAQATVDGDSYQLVLVDYQMPEMDGFELVRRVRSGTEFSNPLIMLLTSDDCNASISRCREIGITAHLIKPIRQMELLDAMRAVLGQNPRHSRESLLPMRQEALIGLQVLLAEDNAVNQKLALRLLERAGASVTLAEDGQQALDLFSTRPFAVILMDVQMPNMDGLTATRIIREREHSTQMHIPIIAMTAHALEGDRERCISGGMDGYLSKPINSIDLIKTIRELIPECALIGNSDSIVQQATL